jgi:hypothetical protein
VTEPQRYEKDEKEEKDSQMNEKGDEKQQEKMDEKSMEEKYRRDPLGSMIWAGILIWAGVVLLGGNLGFLDTLPLPEGMGSWSLVFAGAGVLLFLEVLLRLVVPEYSSPVIGTLIVALIFLGIGLSDYVGWELIWPFLIIVVGLMMLLRGFRRK